MSKVKVMYNPTSYGQFRVGETRDCTVRALANVADVPYDKAHEHMSRNGRQNNAGMEVTSAHYSFVSFGLQCVGIFGRTSTARAVRARTIEGREKAQPGMTLHRAAKTLPKGRYVVLLRGHATSLIDGEIVDSHALSGATSVVAIYKKV
jgi:hypothetical protein